MKKNVISNVSGIIFLGNGNISLFSGKYPQLINPNRDLPWKIVALRFKIHIRILSWKSLYD
jgi:hypothetical protein